MGKYTALPWVFPVFEDYTKILSKKKIGKIHHLFHNYYTFAIIAIFPRFEIYRYEDLLQPQIEFPYQHLKRASDCKWVRVFKAGDTQILLANIIGLLAQICVINNALLHYPILFSI